MQAVAVVVEVEGQEVTQGEEAAAVGAAEVVEGGMEPPRQALNMVLALVAAAMAWPVEDKSSYNIFCISSLQKPMYLFMETFRFIVLP